MHPNTKMIEDSKDAIDMAVREKLAIRLPIEHRAVLGCIVRGEWPAGFAEWLQHNELVGVLRCPYPQLVEDLIDERGRFRSFWQIAGWYRCRSAEQVFVAVEKMIDAWITISNENRRVAA